MFHTTRRYRFSAIHQLPPVEEVHGHDYALEITLSSPHLTDKTYWVFDRTQMDEIVQECVLAKLHGHSLNQYLTVASGENLVAFIGQQLQQTKLKSYLSKVALQETRKNRFEYRIKNISPPNRP